MHEIHSIYDQVANRSLNNAALLSTFDRVIYYNSKHIDDGLYLQIINERLVVFPYVIYFPYHSCFRVPINDQIKWFAASGLLLKWRRNYLKSNLIDTKYMESGFIKIRPLKLIDIEGVFEICGFLYITAAFVFLLEYIVKRLRCRQ